MTSAAGCSFRIAPHTRDLSFPLAATGRLDYEPGTAKWLSANLNKYDTVLDIEANIGLHSLMMASAFERKEPPKLFAFEPAPFPRSRLERNLALNPALHVSVLGAALGERSGLIELFGPAGCSLNGSLRHDFARVFSSSVAATWVPCIAAPEIERIVAPASKALIKLDVEGMEARLLALLGPILLSYKPDVIIEVLDTEQEALNNLAFLRSHFHLLHSSNT